MDWCKGTADVENHTGWIYDIFILHRCQQNIYIFETSNTNQRTPPAAITFIGNNAASFRWRIYLEHHSDENSDQWRLIEPSAKRLLSVNNRIIPFLNYPMLFIKLNFHAIIGHPGLLSNRVWSTSTNSWNLFTKLYICNQWYLPWNVQNGTSTKSLFVSCRLPGHVQKSSRLSSVSLAKNMRLRKKRTGTWVSRDFIHFSLW